MHLFLFAEQIKKHIFAQSKQKCANMENSFIGLIEDSLKKNWDLDALTDYNGSTLQYKDVARIPVKVFVRYAVSVRTRIATRQESAKDIIPAKAYVPTAVSA